MAGYRCIIIEDEQGALDILQSHIDPIIDLTIEHVFRKGIEAKEYLRSNQKHKIDLIFLDIQLADIDGIQFLELLHDLSELGTIPKVIITTAYEEHAVSAYKYADTVIGYLLKPIQANAFHKAFNTFIKTQYKSTDESNSLLENSSSPKSSSDYLFVRVARKGKQEIVKLNLKDIVYIESEKSQTKIYLNGESSPILIWIPINKIIGEFPSPPLVRIHNSFVVSLDYVDRISIGANRVYLSDHLQTDLTIGQKYKSNFIKHIKIVGASAEGD